MLGKPLVATVLALAVSLWTLAGTRSVEFSPPLAGLAAALVVAELASVSLGPFGFLSLGVAYALPLGALYGAPLAVLAVWVSLILRTLGRGHASARGRWLELVADLFPSVLALAALKGLGHVVAAAVVYVFAWLTVPGVVTASLPEELAEHWGRVRDSLLGPAVGLTAVGVFMVLGAASPGLALAVSFAALAGFHRTASMARENEINRTQRSEQQEHARNLTAKERTLQGVQKVQERTKRDLEVRLKIYDMVEDLLAAQPSEPHLEKVTYSLLGMLRNTIPCTSAALLVNSQRRGWVPLGAYSPHLERLNSAALLNLTEPVVEQAWQNAAPVQQSGPGDLNRIFLGEQTALAIPLRNRGVLYLGNEQDTPYKPDQIDFALGLANHAWLAVDAALFFEAQQKALAQEAGARAERESLVQRLAVVLDGVADLVTHQSPDAILEHASRIVCRLIPQREFQLLRLHERERASGLEDLNEIIITVLNHGRPLLLDDLASSRFGETCPLKCKALVAVPVLIRQKVAGIVIVGGPHFAREDMDILSVLSYQLGAAYYSASLFADLEKAHLALKESQAQLIQSSKMAAIGQLAGGVAHELNTPLGAIALAIDGALSNLRNKPERAEKRLERAVGSVEQMKAIVAKLLFYSRDARTLKRETDLNAVIEDTLLLIGNQFRLDNIQVDTILAALPPLLTNQNEVQQVLTNLLINARDAVTSEGARERRIEIATTADAETVSVRIRDWGCGIPKEIQERIFEPFFTTKEVGKGTGLGLSVTLQLLSQHHGTLALDSQPGQGTTFTLKFLRNVPDDE